MQKNVNLCEIFESASTEKYFEVVLLVMESSLENKCMSHKVARKFILYPSELRTACDSVTPLVTPRFNNRFIFSPTTGHRRCKALIRYMKPGPLYFVLWSGI